MTPEQFRAMKEMLDQAEHHDYCMNRKTWDAFKRECWPGHGQIPPGAVRVWIDDKMADNECRPGTPNTGYRVR
jgi:hypothetical protein